MTTIDQRRYGDSVPIAVKRSMVFVFCVVVFIAALLPFTLGINAIKNAAYDSMAANSPHFAYDTTCNPFGSLLTCVQVEAEPNTP